MKIQTGTRLLVLSGLLSLAVISGCGNSTSSKSVSTSENVFYSHAVLPSGDGTLGDGRTLFTLWASGYNGYGQVANGTLTNQIFFNEITSTYSQEPGHQLHI